MTMPDGDGTSGPRAKRAQDRAHRAAVRRRGSDTVPRRHQLAQRG
jgi:hypothetical protein